MEVLRNIVGVARRRPAKLLYLLTSLGVSFGFIAAVVTIGHASWFHLPSGVADRDYVSVVRRTDSGAESVALVDLDNFRQLAPEVSWFYEMPLHGVRVRGSGGDWRSLDAAGTSDGYFDLLGVAAVRGALVPLAEGDGAVVLSHRAWREIYGADEAVVGTLFDIDGAPPMPVVGVAPADFTGVGGRWPIGAWLINPPSVLGMREGESEEGAQIDFERMPNVGAFGVARDTVDMAGLRSLLDDYRFDAEPVRIEREGPSLLPGIELPEGAITKPSVVTRDFGIRDSDRLELVAGLETDPDGRREVVQKTTWLSGVVVLLLVMAFVALLEFLLAENVSREDEQNVRIAVGATPVDVFRQSIAENGVWIVVIGLVGWFAFRYVVDVLLGIEPFAGYIGETTGLARLVGVGTATLLLVVAFVGCVAYLGWFVSRTTLAQSASRTWSRWATRQVLAFVGLASLVFVFSLIGRYAGDARISLGFPNTDVAIVWASKEWGGLGMDTNIGVESMPGVRSAARAKLMPLGHPMNLRFYLVEVLGRAGLDDTPFYRNTVTPGYFATLGVEFLAGRTFDAETENEVVVSRSAAEALGGVDEILGLPLSLSARSEAGAGRPLGVLVSPLVQDQNSRRSGGRRLSARPLQGPGMATHTCEMSTYASKRCVTCGTEFSPRSPRQIYCQPVCRPAGLCARCQQVPAQAGQTYCAACRKAYDGDRPHRGSNEFSERECATCGDLFKPRRQNQVYCSSDCRSKSSRKLEPILS